MYKSGKWFVRIPLIITDYHMHPETKSNRVETKLYFHKGLAEHLFVPTFDPSGCKIFLPHLGENKSESKPRVAIFTITYDRLDYTKRMHDSMVKSTNYPFTWYVVDNGSNDDTVKWLDDHCSNYISNPKNVGISKASNQAVDMIKDGDYDLIVKIDNDCEFLTRGWLEDIVDLWQRNHMVYVSPYVEGLIHNPGGAPRVGHAYIGEKEWSGDKVYYVEVTNHIGGLVAAIDAKAYKKFRWQDEFYHGNQDREASIAFTKLGYMPCYLPKHRIYHIDTTTGQWVKYPEYFERRKQEKMTKI
jgi:GT2 family glycosyltransferase